MMRDEGEAAGCIARGDGLKHLKVPDVRLLLICGAVLLACAVVVALARSRRRGGQMLVQPRVMPPMKSSLGEAPHGPDLALGRELLPGLEQGRTQEGGGWRGWGAEAAVAAVAMLENLRKRLEA